MTFPYITIYGTQIMQSSLDLQASFIAQYQQVAEATDRHIQAELDRQGLTVDDDVMLIYPDWATNRRLGEVRPSMSYRQIDGLEYISIDTSLPMVMLRSEVERIYGSIRGMQSDEEEWD